jgi:hypothetical protein
MIIEKEEIITNRIKRKKKRKKKKIYRKINNNI